MAPSTREETAAWLRLTLVPGVSPRAQQALLRHFGDPAAVIAADPAHRAGIAPTAAAALARGPDAVLLERTLAWLEAPEHHLLTLGDARYPRALLEIPDPPTAIYARGRVELLNTPMLAIVGSRNATPQGVRDAESFARALSEAGLCIASGLALGIDAAAHRGGLAGAASSLAVMGTGVDVLYPPRNRDLGLELAQRGCVISEFALGTPCDRGNFPRRNRLISGLSRGVLVVEAAEESGSRITARFALEQDREVFAVPGSIHSPLSRGCHALIKQGAQLVEGVEDVLQALGMDARAARPRRPAPIRHALLEAMGFAPASADQLAQRTGLAAATVAAQLSQLELERRVSVLAGGWFQRIDPA